MPSTGVDRNTGRVLRGIAHVRQSVEVIFTTQLASRIKRRTFGSGVAPILGRSNLTRPELLKFVTAVHLAIALWEPRLTSVRALFPKRDDAVAQGRQGRFRMRLRCRYHPEALSGDMVTDAEDIDL